MQWFDKLRLAQWPTDVVILDFETYFDKEYALGKISTIEYVTSPQFEEHGLAYLIMTAEYPHAPKKAIFTHDVEGLLRWLQSKYGENLERATIVSHNAPYDGLILVRRHGINPPHYIDLLGVAKHLDARAQNKLAVLCDRYKLPPKGDTNEFLGLHWKYMTPKQQVSMCKYACNDVEREADLFEILMPIFSRPQVELWLQRHTMKMFWEPSIQFDFKQAEPVKKKMQAMLKGKLDKVSLTAKEIRSNTSFVPILNEALGRPVDLKQGKNKMIPALAKDDPEVAVLRTHKSRRVRDLIEARLAAKSWPLHIRRVDRMMAQARAAGGLLPVPLRYYGAHTGRWSGYEKINLQNLGARGDPLVAEIRTTLMAPPGMVLVVGDAAQIEARNVGWIAGQWDLVAAFAAGEPVYCQFATEIVGRPVRKPLKNDPPPVKKWYKNKRALGKVGVLGCGYGMGADRCMKYARDTYHLDIDFSTAERIVKHYREKNDKIVKFWYALENAFRYTTKYGHDCDLDRGLHFSRFGTATCIHLPSGRILYYPHAEIGVDDQLHYHWNYLWGGSLTENIVQAMSRDVLAEAIYILEHQGFTVGHHVHDEIIMVVPIREKDRAKAALLASLRQRPSWAPGFPLDAEAIITWRYQKP